jgi:hypothetical protein
MALTQILVVAELAWARPFSTGILGAPRYREDGDTSSVLTFLESSMSRKGEHVRSPNRGTLPVSRPEYRC